MLMAASTSPISIDTFSNVFFSLVLRLSPSRIYLLSLYILAICAFICFLASVILSALTAAKLMNITGYLPCIFLYSSYFHISSPSNSSLLPLYVLEKKQLTMLILSVFPNLLGLLIKVITSLDDHHSFIKEVLSI